MKSSLRSHRGLIFLIVSAVMVVALVSLLAVRQVRARTAMRRGQAEATAMLGRAARLRSNKLIRKLRPEDPEFDQLIDSVRSIVARGEIPAWVKPLEVIEVNVALSGENAGWGRVILRPDTMEVDGCHFAITQDEFMFVRDTLGRASKRQAQQVYKYPSMQPRARGYFAVDYAVRSRRNAGPWTHPMTRNGQWTLFYENGEKMAEGNYDHGRKVGTWKYWDLDGKPLTVPPPECEALEAIHDADEEPPADSQPGGRAGSEATRL